MAEKQKVCACCGSYDGIPHEGHTYFLESAKQHGELTVFVVPDRVIQRNKRRAPIFSQKERIRNIQELGIADHVVPLVGTDRQQLRQIEAIRPDVYCVGEDQLTPFHSALFRRLKRIGTSIVEISHIKPDVYSTTRLHFSSPSS